MRILLILLFIPLVTGWTNLPGSYTSEEDAQAYCDSRQESQPQYAYRVIDLQNGYFKCQWNTNPCTSPEVFNQVSRNCQIPCLSGDAGFWTVPANKFLSCKNDCELIQTSDWECTGTAAEGGTCTGRFSYTGAFCPSPSTGPDESSPAEPGSHPDYPDGDPDPDPDPDPGDGGTSGGGGGGGTGSIGDSDGDGQHDGFGGSASGGFDCEEQPVCEANGADGVTCEILRQQWLMRCPNNTLEPGIGNGEYDGESDHGLDIHERVGQAQQDYEQRFSEIADELSNMLNLGVSGGGAGLPCSYGTIFGVQIQLGICARSDFFQLIAGIFYACATVLAAYIILRKG